MNTKSMIDGKVGARRRRESGFTMFELMVVVAIMAIVLALALMTLTGFLKRSKQRQLDETAKEIFIAAQNHLSLAKSQGILDTASLPGNLVPSTADAQNKNAGFYFIAHASGVDVDADRGSVLYLMLPFASIDDGKRENGSYLIRYQLKSAKVLDVFYAEDYDFLQTEEEYNRLFVTGGGYLGDDKKAARQDYQGIMIGYYGGDGEGVSTSSELEAPTVRVFNGDQLKVEVVNKAVAESGRNLSLKLIVEGRESKAAMFFDLIGEAGQSNGCVSVSGNTYEIILDDVTKTSGDSDKIAGVAGSGLAPSNKPGRFAKAAAIRPEGTTKLDGGTPKVFIPGEDLIIYAWATYSNGFGTVAKSKRVVANSLFGDGTEYSLKDGEESYIAAIRSFRHLANLDESVSGFDRLGKMAGGSYAISKVEALQKTDLSWPKYLSAVGDTDSIETRIQTDSTGETNKAAADTFRPVLVDYPLAYDGGVYAMNNTKSAYLYVDTNGNEVSQGDSGSERVFKGCHSITGLSVNYSGPAGLFSAIQGFGSIETSVTGLEFVGATITSTGTGDNGKAGTLAGYTDGGARVRISNVLVRNAMTNVSGASVTGTSYAGGLLGTSDCSISGCAASVKVTADGPAGGLVGNATAGSIVKSYAAGHTSDGKYSGAGFSNNVTSNNGVAGGLIGLSAADISNSYSTCSVSGATAETGAAGGLVGSVTGGSVSDCYATGAASSGENRTGAFVGILGNGASVSGKYLKVVNQDMPPIGSDPSTESVTEGDKNLLVYLGDSGNPEAAPPIPATPAFAPSTGDAIPYDTTLAKRFDGLYTFNTIAQLTGITAAKADKVPNWLTTHYGDWPAYETEVINTKS